MIKILKHLICKHDYELICWHWCHGYNMCEPRQIEAQYKCKKCGKIKYLHIENIEKAEEYAINNKDKRWSSTCNPIL